MNLTETEEKMFRLGYIRCGDCTFRMPRDYRDIMTKCSKIPNLSRKPRWSWKKCIHFKWDMVRRKTLYGC